MVAFLLFAIWIIRYGNSKVKDGNAQRHTACGEMRLVSSFTDVNKVFVVCSPEYVSSSSDFVVREVR
jgi:uncharacterized protein (DUF983 family)